MKMKYAPIGLACLMAMNTAYADLEEDIQAEITKNQAQVERSMGTISNNLMALFAHRGLAPAETLGGGIGGFEIALDTTFTEFDTDAIQSIAGSDTDLDVNTLALPKLSAAIGLPVIPLDIGMTYLPEVAGFSYFGTHAKYSLIDGGMVTPAVAISGNYSKATMDKALETTTMGAEVSVSKGFGVGVKAVPYAGIGYVTGTTKLSNNAVPTGSTIKTDYDVSATKLFLGASLQLGLINLVGQWDKIGDYQSYNAKLGFRF